MKCFCVNIINIILLLYSFSLFLLPLVFWGKASLPYVDDDEHYVHGLIVWDGDPQTVNPPDIELGADVIGEAVVVVYDVTNENSFLEAKKLVRFYTRLGIPGHLYIEGPRVVVLVGSKADLLMDRKIKYEVSSYHDFIHV